MILVAFLHIQLPCRFGCFKMLRIGRMTPWQSTSLLREIWATHLLFWTYYPCHSLRLTRQLHLPEPSKNWGIVTGRFLEKGIHLNQVTGRFFEPNDLLPGRETAWWKQIGMLWNAMDALDAGNMVKVYNNELLILDMDEYSRKARMQWKGCFRISTCTGLRTPPKKNKWGNMLHWHQKKLLRWTWLLGATCVGLWKPWCLAPHLRLGSGASEIAWFHASAISLGPRYFQAAFLNQKMTYCQILYVRCKRGVQHPSYSFQTCTNCQALWWWSWWRLSAQDVVMETLTARIRGWKKKPTTFATLDQLLRCSQCRNSNKPWKNSASSCPQRTHRTHVRPVKTS